LVAGAWFAFKYDGAFTHDFTDGKVLGTKPFTYLASGTKGRLVLREPPSKVHHNFRVMFIDLPFIV